MIGNEIRLRIIHTSQLSKDLTYILENIDHSVFGAQFNIKNNKVNKFILSPPHIHKKENYRTVDTDIGKFGEFKHFKGYLSQPNFMPLKMALNANFEKQLNLFKELVKENEEVVVVWLFKKKYNWRDKAIDMYQSYLKGNDTPSTIRLFRNVQEKGLSVIDKVSNHKTKREYSDDVGDKLLDSGYDFGLRVLVKSKRSNELIDYLNDKLTTYDLHNSLQLESTKIDYLYELFELNQMLCRREMNSLLSGQKESIAEETVEEKEIKTETVQPKASNNNVIDILPYLEKEEIKVDEGLVKRLEEALKRTKVTNQARLYETVIQAGARLTVIQANIPTDKTITDVKKKLESIQAELGVQSLGIEQGDKAGTVKFSIPNEAPQIVSLRELIEREDFHEFNKEHPLAFVVGVDELNNPIYLSLKELVHLLVAGTTGSGKSVFINCLLTCLLSFYKPDELTMFLIDPKQIELQQYKEFPHVQDVITDMSQASETLEALVVEMERRYEKFSSQKGVRNIESYNEVSKEKLPYIVVAIDEFADLKMVNPEVEDHIQRLGQKARAAGIHLIIATQRPSADILSKKIQANTPNAISFYLASSSDYVTVFGKGLKDYKLLGKGDGAMRIEGWHKEFQRFQSPIIHTNNIEEGKVFDKLIDHYKDYEPSKPIIVEGSGEDIPLIDQLKKIIAETKETKTEPLRKALGVKGTTFVELRNQLVEEGWLVKHNSKAKGYELVADKEILDKWKDD